DALDDARADLGRGGALLFVDDGVGDLAGLLLDREVDDDLAGLTAEAALDVALLLVDEAPGDLAVVVGAAGDAGGGREREAQADDGSDKRVGVPHRAPHLPPGRTRAPPPEVSPVPILTILNSTRRLAILPSSVELSAIGSDGPLPSEITRAASTP